MLLAILSIITCMLKNIQNNYINIITSSFQELNNSFLALLYSVRYIILPFLRNQFLYNSSATICTYLHLSITMVWEPSQMVNSTWTSFFDYLFPSNIIFCEILIQGQLKVRPLWYFGVWQQKGPNKPGQQYSLKVQYYFFFFYYSLWQEWQLFVNLR